VLDAAWPAVAPESGLCVPARIRYDREKEYIYVLDSGNSLLSIFHRNSNFISALRGADRTFREPRGFSFKPESGEFAVADTGNSLVQKFTLR
jgi:DNA-binding beta-propeller fold protein YncE